MSIYRNIGISFYTLSAKAVCILSAALAAVLLTGCSPRVATSFWRIGTPSDSTREGYAVFHEGKKARHCYPVTEWTSTDEKEDVYHSLHHHGVAVESEQMAYRIYFDKKQTIDPYCKRTPQLELAESHWYPNDSLLAAGYGDDILRVSGTVGVGSVKFWNGKKMVHIEHIRERSQRIVRQTLNAATIEVAVKGWEVPKSPIANLKSQIADIAVQYTLRAGHRDMRCDVYASAPVEGLCTGVQFVPKDLKDPKDFKDFISIQLPNGVLLASWGTDWPVNDSAKYAKETVGLAVFIPKTYAGESVRDKQNNLCLLHLQTLKQTKPQTSNPSNSPTGEAANYRCHFYLTCCGATKENHPVARTAEEWYAYLRKWAKGLK
ncbi:MAG: DUF4861 family protein [Paludibacteraceae bacterium]|nr:DUF4861 family protein [Paludibacteraceae bacterium]